MRTFCFAVSFATLAACSPAPVDTAQEAAQPVATAVAPARTAGIDGWEIDMTAYSKVGTLLPAYVVKQPNGTDATPESNAWV
jgi:hypothetical protein